MSKSIVELLVGNLDEKRSYRTFMKRVNNLPKEYRFAFKKILKYSYYTDFCGFNMDMFTDLLELFETNSAQGKSVLEVIGKDVTGFCDELISASSPNRITSREKLNEEILSHFGKREV